MKDFSRLAQGLSDRNIGGRNIRFRAATTDGDVRAAIRINASLFGASKRFTEDELVQTRLLWIERNPDIYHILEVDGNIIGFLTTIPLLVPVIGQLIAGQITISDLHVEDIQIGEPGFPINIFLQTVGVHRTIEGHARRIAGKYLISGMLGLLSNLGKRGIEIQALYTRSDEVDGINLAYRLGLEEFPPPPGVMKKVFKLDFTKPDLPFLVGYQQALEAYKSS